MTKLEEQWVDAIVQIRCIVCYMRGFPGTPAEVHHILDGGRRIGHLDTLPLCSPGHHRNGDGRHKISRHPNKARFEEAYGTEESLLAKSRLIVVQRFELFIGVDIDAVHHKLEAVRNV